MPSLHVLDVRDANEPQREKMYIRDFGVPIMKFCILVLSKSAQ